VVSVGVTGAGATPGGTGPAGASSASATATRRRLDLVGDPPRVGRERRLGGIRDLDFLVRLEIEDTQHRLRISGDRVHVPQSVDHPLAVAGHLGAVDAAPACVVVRPEDFLPGNGSGRHGRSRRLRLLRMNRGDEPGEYCDQGERTRAAAQEHCETLHDRLFMREVERTVG
jgi:hypothetical protein